jgi:predicted nucleic acid-binding protein
MKPISGKLQFLDTNILVYAYSEDDLEKREVARNLMSSGEVVISTQVLQEFANISHRKLKVNWEEIQATIEELSCKIPVWINSEETVKKPCQIAFNYSYSFYDSLIIVAALESQSVVLFSEDMHGGQKVENQLEIVNPFKG